MRCCHLGRAISNQRAMHSGQAEYCPLYRQFPSDLTVDRREGDVGPACDPCLQPWHHRVCLSCSTLEVRGMRINYHKWIDYEIPVVYVRLKTGLARPCTSGDMLRTYTHSVLLCSPQKGKKKRLYSICFINSSKAVNAMAGDRFCRREVGEKQSKAGMTLHSLPRRTQANKTNKQPSWVSSPWSKIKSILKTVVIYVYISIYGYVWSRTT